METYTIRSVKHTERFAGTFAAAIARAEAIDAEYQPSFGTQIEDSEGATIWDSEEPAAGPATATQLRTADGLAIYDLDPQASELWAVAGPAGYDPAQIDPEALPEGFRWVSAEEWESAAGNTMGGMAVDSRRYHIFRHQAGCAPIYCGTMYGLPAARSAAATEPDGISQDLWATSRLAPIYGLVAPEIDEDAEAIEWHGEDGTWGIFQA